VIEPLVLSFDIDCDPKHAFSTWTERFSRWWPRGHTVTGDPDVEIVLEPRVGGRIFERTTDGTEIDWGEVTHWEPPTRFAYLWHIRRDRADATDVELTFADAGNGTTRLEIVHTGWERLGVGAVEWRDANRGGWAGLLPHFISYATGTAERHRT
jgi:Activator of Hsp90 ATPase homolog 1-like protein